MQIPLVWLIYLSAAPYAGATVNKWTPEGFDWSQLKSYHGVLRQNVSASTPSKELVRYAAERYNMTELDVHNPDHVLILDIVLGLGITVRTAISGALTLAGAAGAVDGCIQAANSPSVRSVFFCSLGIVSTLGGVGLSLSAKKAIPATVAAAEELAENLWDTSGLLQIADDVFSRRKRNLEGRSLSKRELVAQILHDDSMLAAVRSAGFKDAEHIGYEDEHHPFSKRDGNHPLAARILFTHPWGGRMVAISRDVANETHITLEPWYENHEQDMSKRDGGYRDERLQSGGLIEGRFDRTAQDSDPNSISTDEDGSEPYNAIEGALECFVGEQGLSAWPDMATFDIQMYDNTNEETFGYGSVGIFAEDNRGGVGGVQPAPPLTGGQSCA